MIILVMYYVNILLSFLRNCADEALLKHYYQIIYAYRIVTNPTGNYREINIK